MPAAVMTSVSAKPVAASTGRTAARRSVRAMAAGAPSMVPDMDKRVSCMRWRMEREREVKAHGGSEKWLRAAATAGG